MSKQSKREDALHWRIDRLIDVILELRDKNLALQRELLVYKELEARGRVFR